MDRINHVKIISPDPEAVDQFLREVVDIPEGWPLGPMEPSPEVGAPVAGDGDGGFTLASVFDFRGPFVGGVITGTPESRQFQILQGASPAIWSVAIGTRHLERAHERCEARGIPCTEIGVTEWKTGAIQFFFAEVGGIVFEVMRSVSGAAPPQPGS